MHLKSAWIQVVLALSLVGCQMSQSLSPLYMENIPIKLSIQNDPTIDRMIEPYKSDLQQSMNRIVGFCPKFMEKQKPTSQLGNFMANAVEYTAQKAGFDVDFCILNYGSIRSTLDSGDITIGELFELMPFENKITILMVSPKMVVQIQSIIQQKGGEPTSTSFNDIHLNNNDTANYLIATSDYVANGGDGYTFLEEAEKRWDIPIKVRDGIIKYTEAFNPIPLTTDSK